MDWFSFFTTANVNTFAQCELSFHLETFTHRSVFYAYYNSVPYQLVSKWTKITYVCHVSEGSHVPVYWIFFILRTIIEDISLVGLIAHSLFNAEFESFLYLQCLRTNAVKLVTNTTFLFDVVQVFCLIQQQCYNFTIATSTASSSLTYFQTMIILAWAWFPEVLELLR